MPIPVAVLQQANRSLRDRILEFLEKNPSQAYSDVEVYAGLEGLSETSLAVLVLFELMNKGPLRLEPIRAALAALEQEGLVQSAAHNNITYYAIRSR
jgi:hypothetical protein